MRVSDCTMSAEDQQPTIELLASPSTHGGAQVERIETHSAIVFLAGARAWKLKRAVRFDYLDFSTADRRRAMCEAEVAINRRAAPRIYRGVAAVTREADGSLALKGSGAPVDWVVEMNRFDQAGLLDRLAARGGLSHELMDRLASSIARFHARASHRDDHGGPAGMRLVIEGNASGLAEFGAAFLDRALCARLNDDAASEVARHAALLDARRQAGLVRQCHGDLHLRNIVLLDNEPTLFDAIEFNDELACVDVLYDLAFLLMDLWRQGMEAHANLVLNRYLAYTGELDGLALLPLFLSCRAAVRAKTSATAAAMAKEAARVRDLQRASSEYLTLAWSLLHPPPPALVAIGGLSGAGKSTLALGIAPTIGAVPGAIVLRSDEIRKELCGVPRWQRLMPQAYGAGISARVYATLAARAAAILRSGHSVIVDAVYGREADRDAIEDVARSLAVRFDGLWLEAPTSTLIERVQSREQDPSDADAGVVRAQAGEDIGGLRWHRVDAGAAENDVQRHAQALLRRNKPLAH